MKHFVFNIRPEKGGKWGGYLGWSKALTFEGKEQAEGWLRKMRAARSSNCSSVQAVVSGDRKYFEKL